MSSRFRSLSLAGLTVLAFGGCTFGGLADYEIALCTPASSQAADECNSLDTDPQSCSPFQCDATTRRCVRKLRDDDHDGDPAAACSPAGKGDCDDRNAAVSSLRVGTPAVLAGATLPDEVAKIGLSTDGGDAPTFAFVSKTSGGECLSVAKADVASTTFLGGCQLLAKSVGALPTQVETRRVGEGAFAAAFVSLSACSQGKLAFSYSDKLALEPCGDGAARPALAMLDSASAAVGWYAVAHATRASALDNCAAATPAPLRVKLVGSIAEPSFSATPTTLSEFATSLSAPAMIVRDGVLFVASPTGENAAIWALDRTLNVLTTMALPGLSGARSTSMAAYRIDVGRWRLGVVAESGCDRQPLRLVLVDFDPAASTFTVVGSSEIAPTGAAFQWQPSIAWVPARKSWLVAWFTTGPKPMARFVADDGKPGAAPSELTARALSAGSLSSGHVALVGSGAGGQQLLDSPVRCP